MLDRLMRRTELEVRYMLGTLTMHRERYREYLANLRRASIRGDAKRAKELSEDLLAFRGEIRMLRRKYRRATERMDILSNDRVFENPSDADGPPRNSGER